MTCLKTKLKKLITDSKCVKISPSESIPLCAKYIRRRPLIEIKPDIRKFSDYFKDLGKKSLRESKDNLFIEFLKETMPLEYERCKNSRKETLTSKPKEQINPVSKAITRKDEKITDAEQLQEDINRLLIEINESLSDMTLRLNTCEEDISLRIKYIEELGKRSLEISSYERQRYVYNLRKCETVEN
uniref:Late transcription factor VLTF3 n=1 Tax=Parastrongyloides trichosuri TaxID=131310 RepID=A0A0N4Z5H0_PARTI